MQGAPANIPRVGPFHRRDATAQRAQRFFQACGLREAQIVSEGSRHNP